MYLSGPEIELIPGKNKKKGRAGWVLTIVIDLHNVLIIGENRSDYLEGEPVLHCVNSSNALLWVGCSLCQTTCCILV